MTRRFSAAGVGAGRTSRLAALTSLLLALIFLGSNEATARTPHYSLTLSLDIAHRTVYGCERVRFDLESLDSVTLHGENLIVDSIFFGSQRAAVAYDGNALRFAPGSPDTPGVTIYYHGSPTRGLHMDSSEVFTAFHTAAWMFCDDRPGERATYDLTLELPPGFVATASGERDSAASPRSVRYVQHTPIPAYTFGLAAGRFVRVSRTVHGVRVTLLTPSAMAAHDRSVLTRRVMASTSTAIEYLQGLTGQRYPYPEYTIVFTRADNEQEAARFTLLSSSYASDILEDSTEDWLLLHELAHQWFGNSVTCRTWSEFWLNEGLVTYLTAAMKEREWGASAYEREMWLARNRVERASHVRSHALVSSNWSQPEEMGDNITYYKGALVLNYLRYVIGDDAFARGLRRFARDHWMSAVGTPDLQYAMERSSGHDLGSFFQYWVYDTASPGLTATYHVRSGSIELTFEQTGQVAQSLPLQVAVETANGRRDYDLVLKRQRQSVALPLDGELLSLRLDDGGRLPSQIRYDRPEMMLAYQAQHEPDLIGRIDAMQHLAAKFGGPSTTKLLTAISGSDSSRFVRTIAQRLLQQK